MSEFTSLFRAIDTKDAEAFVGHLTEDAVFVYGSQPAVEGRVAIRDYVVAFFDMFAGLEHRIANVHEIAPDRAFVEGHVTYSRKGKPGVTLPFANTFRLRDGKITDYRIYIDPSPLAG
jgi:uncharacterized protein (TIGR02246 family)